MPRSTKKGKKPEIFGRRAQAFADAMEKANSLGKARKNKVSQTVSRDFYDVPIGLGPHRRLIAGRKKQHMVLALAVHHIFERYLGLRGTKPKKYCLGKIYGVPKLGIREYINMPSVWGLTRFFEDIRPRLKPADKRRSKPLPISDYDLLMCKKFVKEYPDITLGMLKGAFKEFDADYRAGLGGMYPRKRNILLMGQDRKGRIRFGIADV